MLLLGTIEKSYNPLRGEVTTRLRIRERGVNIQITLENKVGEGQKVSQTITFSKNLRKYNFLLF